MTLLYPQKHKSSVKLASEVLCH